MNATLKANSKVITLGLVAFGLLFGGCAGNMNSATIDESSIQTKVFQPLMGSCDSGSDERLVGANGGKGPQPIKATAVFEGSANGGKGLQPIKATAVFEGSANGGKVAEKVALNECAQQSVEVSGVCEGCESVMAKIGSEEFAVSVDEYGNFSFAAPIDTEVQLTPMNSNGELNYDAVTKL